MVCDACRQRFRACMPPPIYHKHRLCHMCVGTVFPEMATAPIVGETEVHH